MINLCGKRFYLSIFFIFPLFLLIFPLFSPRFSLLFPSLANQKSPKLDKVSCFHQDEPLKNSRDQIKPPQLAQNPMLQIKTPIET